MQGTFSSGRIEGEVPHGDDYEHDESVGTAFHNRAAESKAVQETACLPRMKHNQDGGNKRGALDLWISKRMKQERCVNGKHVSLFWEWEQGVRKGVGDFYAIVGVWLSEEFG